MEQGNKRSAAGPEESAHPVLFYDGECGLCAASVRWCLDRDRRGVLRFAPLQGRTYAAIPLPDKPTDLQTMVLFEDGRLLLRGDAALRCLRHIGGAWRILGAIGACVPRAGRDALYNFVARRRIAWFGPADACKLPGAAERVRFLD